MLKKEKAQATAQKRLELLAPLLTPGLDQGKYQALKHELAQNSSVCERTIRRYMKKYREKGIVGLESKSRSCRIGQSIPENVLAEAIILRREVPSRSISQIIDILESEEIIQPGLLKRSTLQDYFSAKGYSARQMRLYENVKGQATRRFQHRNRNDLWQSDIKYGPYLPCGQGGKLQQCYLVTYLDDATRYIVHAEFYNTLDQSIVEDAFRNAIIKWGAPLHVYFDNGKQYRNKWMTNCCHKLNIRLLYAKPYAAASKGKVEKFNRLVDNFLAELHLSKTETLSGLNEIFSAWLSECYQNKAHSALKDEMSPYVAYQRDKTSLRLIAKQKLNEAFMHYEERRVDKAGCISLKGIKYDVGWEALGKKVTVSYDPKDMSRINVAWQGKSWIAQELTISEYCQVKPKVPEGMLPLKTNDSRVLKVASQKYKKRLNEHKQAVSYLFMEGE